jgi:two-component system, NtrC family, response regulator HydG
VNRILIVDDAPVIRQVLEEVLADEGYAVETAPDGCAAWAIIAAAPPDLVISDVHMPCVDGWALLGKVRERFPLLPVLLISASSDPPGSHSLPEHTTFLAKPFSLDALLDVVARMIGA